MEYFSEYRNAEQFGLDSLVLQLASEIAKRIWENRSMTVDRDAERRGATAQTVERAIAILNLFRRDPAALGISAIAASTGLKVSTAHRLVRTLVIEGLMQQDPETERYRLGPMLALLGQSALRASGLDRIQPLVDELETTCGETVSLSMRHGSTVSVVLRSGSHQALRFEHPVGAAIEIHASAMGKVLLAFSSEPLPEAVAALGTLERFTPTTITSPTQLIAELADILAVGVAINLEERYVGVRGIAAPVLDRSGAATYTIGIQGPSVRLTDNNLEQLKRLILDAAHRVAILLSDAG